MNDRVLEAVTRLERISPMPDDGNPQLTVPLLAEYEEVVRQIEEAVRQAPELDPALIRPLIASFGYGDAFGLYWATLHLLENFPSEQLRPALCEAVQTGKPGARMWSAYMLGRQRDRRDIPVLVDVLKDSMSEVRYYTLMALAMIRDPNAITAMESLLQDPDPKVRKAAIKYLDELLSLGNQG